ncbi:hypothetical protein [Ralstonia solanacearum species complex bacterium KE056]|uniref:hypothetical protein n=1 Tax=Ralstonia solanacearum species complex bacterium KE056 TaxID=3119585 RepID=UPI002FC395C9
MNAATTFLSTRFLPGGLCGQLLLLHLRNEIGIAVVERDPMVAAGIDALAIAPIQFELKVIAKHPESTSGESGVVHLRQNATTCKSTRADVQSLAPLEWLPFADQDSGSR